MPEKSRFQKTIDSIFAKFFKINDSAQKIALGVALGVFSGLMPGTGPVAALFLAFIFKANRAAALLGSLLTNTWLSFVTFILAIKVGSVILKMNWQEIPQKVQILVKDFSWARSCKFSFAEVFLPLIVGYVIIGLILGAVSYLVTLLIIRRNFYGSKTTHP